MDSSPRINKDMVPNGQNEEVKKAPETVECLTFAQMIRVFEKDLIDKYIRGRNQKYDTESEYKEIAA
jgi:hypothetical protein